MFSKKFLAVRVVLVGTLAGLLLALPAQASPTTSTETNKQMMDKQMMATPEMKKNMADMHQKMADCLKTDKQMQDCHSDMMKTCKSSKMANNCPMMDEMMKKGSMQH